MKIRFYQYSIEHDAIYEPHQEKDRFFPYAKTKAQTSFALTAKLIRAFVFTTPIVQFLYLIQNFQPLAIFCACTARFVSDLFGNPEDWFSRVAAQIQVELPKMLIR